MPNTIAYSFGDVVLVPFPFTDQTAVKKQPAVVVSADAYHQRRPDVIVMAVTHTLSEIVADRLQSRSVWVPVKTRVDLVAVVGVPEARQLEPDRDLAEDQWMGSGDGLGGFLRTRRPFGRLANDALGILVFVLTDRGRDSTDIEVVRLADVLSDPVQLVNDGVSAFHRELPAGSSSGVQIIGGVRPADRQIASIVPRMAAFAMCLQFHVNK